MRLIDADALMKTALTESCFDSQTEDVFLDLVDAQPTIEAEPVRHGTWILHADGSGTCMECKSRQKIVWDYDNWQRYCGCCGAKMDRGVSDEE